MSSAENENTGNQSQEKKEASKPMSKETQLMIANRIAELEVTDKNGITTEEKKAISDASAKRKSALTTIIDGDGDASTKLTAVAELVKAWDKEIVSQSTQAVAGKRKQAAVARARDSLQLEFDKVSVARNKLADLCRGLQAANKQYVEESQKVQELEAARREEQQTKFQTAIEKISNDIKIQDEKRLQQVAENKSHAEKLEKLLEQYQLREQHHEGTLKATGLEKQLLEAKLAHRNAQFDQLEEMYKLEAAKNEKLTADLSSYSEKFELFQTTLTSSTESFATMKKEMQAAAKLRKQLEKDNNTLRGKTAGTDAKLLELAQANQELTNSLTASQKKVQTLENLCRTLQARTKDASE